MIRPGDLVRVGGEHPLTAEVLKTSREGMRRGHLLVMPVCGGSRVRLSAMPDHWPARDVLTRDVEAHWRRAGQPARNR